MKNEFDLKALWGRQQAVMPEMTQTLSRARAVKQEVKRKTILLLILLIATILYVIYIWWASGMKLTTTKAGISLAILAIVILVVNQLKLVFFIRHNCALANREYLHHLIGIRKKQEYTSRTVMSVYFLLLSAGIGLYMYEPLQHMSGLKVGLVYLVVFAFFVYMWLFVRPKRMKQQQRELNQVIGQLEKYQSQLQDS
ncbi:MAG TPA: hypothetical protein VM802_05105 [Chitinophaga sp.]|uniref:hypothetical protein n=1 Tax=Chitinophaga sp. TaxID=1869181 RepID=UPI002CFCD5BF|nr:hypothetical protein [Chitinophaga sp.]HVI44220.1 hypothetical protein [Chitinophaga sp.]